MNAIVPGGASQKKKRGNNPRGKGESGLPPERGRS